MYFKLKNALSKIHVPSSYQTTIVLLLGLIPLIYWVFMQINQPLWWDEIVSFKLFSLTDLSETVNNYPQPNNHIFFNLINNVFSKLLGIADVYQVVDSVYMYRLLQLVFASVSLLYVYITIRDFFDAKYAVIVIVIVVSSIPFLNFALQLRGYNISMTFAVMAIYHAWLFLKSNSKIHLFVLFFAIFLMLYTIPSNLYFVVALYFGLLYEHVNKYIKLRKERRLLTKKQKKKMKKNIMRWYYSPFIIISIVFGFAIIATYLSYLPVMDDLFDNKYAKKVPDNRFFVLVDIFPTVIKSFFSERWFLIVIVFSLWLVQKRKVKFLDSKLISLIIIFILPFVLGFIHNKLPFERNFINLAPIFAIIITVFIIKSFKKMRANSNVKFAVILLIVVYSAVTAIYKINQIDDKLNSNLTERIKEQNLYRNYYLASCFRPNEVAKAISSYVKNKKPVLLADNIDVVSSLLYNEYYDVSSLYIQKLTKVVTKQGNRRFNHTCKFIKSIGKGKDNLAIKFPCNIKQDEETSTYRLLFAISEYLEKNKNPTLISSFPNIASNTLAKIKDYDIKYLKNNGAVFFAVSRPANSRLPKQKVVVKNNIVTGNISKVTNKYN